MALTDNLIGFWELEEASGDRADATASALTLTDNNTVTSNTGKVGTAGQFTRANSEYLSRASEAALQTGDIDFSLQAWVYCDSRANQMILVGKDVDSPANSRDFTLDYDSASNRFRFYINGGSGSLLVTDTTALASATWYHVCCGHDSVGNTVWIQVDAGTLNTSGTSGVAPQSSSAEFRIGARAYASFEGYFDGRIDQVGFWKRNIQPDVSTLYNSGGGLSYAAMQSGGGGTPQSGRASRGMLLGVR